MQFKIKQNYLFKSVQVVEENTVIDLGLLNEKEAKELAMHLVDAASELLSEDLLKIKEKLTVASMLIENKIKQEPKVISH